MLAAMVALEVSLSVACNCSSFVFIDGAVKTTILLLMGPYPRSQSKD